MKLKERGKNGVLPGSKNCLARSRRTAGRACSKLLARPRLGSMTRPEILFRLQTIFDGPPCVCPCLATRERESPCVSHTGPSLFIVVWSHHSSLCDCGSFVELLQVAYPARPHMLRMGAGSPPPTRRAGGGVASHIPPTRLRRVRCASRTSMAQHPERVCAYAYAQMCGPCFCCCSAAAADSAAQCEAEAHLPWQISFSSFAAAGSDRGRLTMGSVGIGPCRGYLRSNSAPRTVPPSVRTVAVSLCLILPRRLREPARATACQPPLGAGLVSCGLAMNRRSLDREEE